MSKNYTVLIKETLSSLRKNLSQEQLNRKLKLSANQVARWESGRAAITWSSFCQLAEATKSPLKEALRKHIYFEDDFRDSQLLIKFLTHFHSQKHIAEKLGVSKAFVSKLVAGKSQLDLEVFFKLVDLSPYSLMDLLGELTAPHFPKSIRAHQERALKEKKLHFEKPWVAALLLYLNTPEYMALAQHSNRFFAQKLGLPEPEIQRALHEMEEIEIIRKKGTHYTTEARHLRTGGNFAGAVNIRKYWLNRCLKEISESQPGVNNYFGYQVFHISETGQKKLEEFYFRMHAELIALMQEDEKNPVESVYLYSFQMFDIDQSKRRSGSLVQLID